MKRSTPPAKPLQNAFAVLMGSHTKKKPRQEVSSRFVPCPAGCGRQVPEKNINAHLDLCILSASNDKVDKSPQERACHLEENVKVPAEEANDHASTAVHPLTRGNKDDHAANTFSHMMKRSAKVFSTNTGTKLAQRFHLNADGSLSLTCYSTYPGLSQQSNVQWGTTVQLKFKKQSGPALDGGIDGESPVLIDVSLSSEIPSSPAKVRLVRRHSRLSVPVLKSILQKSIRRRRPLPAVRVAMELADKSLGDLLRRLPIIILEDSSMHPSFPLLIWLMVAHSKDFEPNQMLITKVLCAIYEIASCPWQDHLNRNEEQVCEKTGDSPSLESYHQPGLDKLLEDHQVMIWSMMVRERYGGMGCDMTMLRAYAQVWDKRFENDCDVPDTVRQRVENCLVDGMTSLRWSMIPKLIHQTAIRQSTARVQLLAENGLSSLVLMDITIEGVDFHCSSVLDGLISQPEFVDSSCTQLTDLTINHNLGTIPASPNDRRAWLERVLKHCMWNYSAGVNRRLPLMEATGATSTAKQEDSLEAFWKAHILPRTRLFAETYVKDRLV